MSDELRTRLLALLEEADRVSWVNGGDRFDHGNVLAYNWLRVELHKLATDPDTSANHAS